MSHISNSKHSIPKLTNYPTMKLRYRTCLYTLIQLVSILSLSTLAQSQARQASTTTEPPLRLEVGSARPGGSQRVLQVILSNVSADLIDPAKYSLVYREKDGKPFVIHCKNTKDKSIAVAPGQFLPLTELLGTEMLSTGKGTNRAFQLTLVPGNGVTHAALALSIEDAQGNSVSKPLSVTWRPKPFWTTQKVFTYVVGALATLALLGKVIGYFRGGTPSAGPDCDPNLEEPSGCTPRLPVRIILPQYNPETDKGKQPQFWNGYPSALGNAPNTLQPQSGPGENQRYSWPSLPKDDSSSALERRCSLGPHPSIVSDFLGNNITQSSTKIGAESSQSFVLQPGLPSSSRASALVPGPSDKQQAVDTSLEPVHNASQPGSPSLETYQGSASSAADSSLREPGTDEAADTASSQKNASSPEDSKPSTPSRRSGPPSTETSKESKSSEVDSLSRSRASSSTYQTASEHASESPAQDDFNDCMLVDTAKEQKEDIIKKGLALLNKIYGPNRDPHFELLLEHVCMIINFLYVQAEAKNQAFTEGTYVVDDSEGKLFEALKSALVEQYLDQAILRREKLAQKTQSLYSIGKKKGHFDEYRISLPINATLHTETQSFRFFSFQGLDGKKKLFLKPEQDGETISTFCKSAYTERLEDLGPVLWGQLSRFKEILKSKLDTKTYQSLEDQIKLFGLSYVYRCCNIPLGAYTFEPTQPVEKPSNSYIGATYSYVCSLFFGQPSPTSPYEVAQSIYQVELISEDLREIAALKAYLEKNFDHLKCRMGREVIFGFQDLGMSTPEQNAIWEDVFQGLKITINGQTISPQSFADTSLTGITEEDSKEQFLGQLKGVIPEELQESLWPLLSQRLAEMISQYIVNAYETDHNAEGCMADIFKLLLRDHRFLKTPKIQSRENIQEIKVKIDSSRVTLAAELGVDVEIMDPNDTCVKTTGPLIINVTIPLEREACKQGQDIDKLPPTTKYTIRFQNSEWQQCYLELVAEKTMEKIWKDVTSRNLKITINGQDITSQRFGSASSTGIMEEASKTEFFNNLTKAIAKEDLSTEGLSTKDLFARCVPPALFPLLHQELMGMCRLYGLSHPKDSVPYKVFKFLDRRRWGTITGDQYTMHSRYLQPRQPRIGVAINKDTITLTTQLKAPIQITPLSNQPEEVPLLLNFNIPLPLAVCQSGEEIHHLPEETRYTIEYENPNQLPLLETAYHDCIAGAQAATA